MICQIKNSITHLDDPNEAQDVCVQIPHVCTVNGSQRTTPAVVPQVQGTCLFLILYFLKTSPMHRRLGMELALCYQGIQRASLGWGRQTGAPSVYRPRSQWPPFSLFLGDRSFTGPELVEAARLHASLLASAPQRVCLSLPSQGWNFKCAPPHLALLREVQGESRPSLHICLLCCLQFKDHYHPRLITQPFMKICPRRHISFPFQMYLLK